MLKYIKIRIGDNEVVVNNFEDLPISIDYLLEDPDNFQKKRSSQSLGIKIPALLMNDVAANTFRNADIVDLTDGQVFRSNQPCVIESNGWELLIGKAFLTSATHTNRPNSYEYDVFGDNADWQIDLQEKTLYDFLKHINFTFTKDNIIDSWDFDGTDENLPYVFAPVRYRGPMGGYATDSENKNISVNDNMLPIYMRPSISPYWILYWAFKSLGYRIQSDFFETDYFRRKVMPWTWGNFLDSDGTRLSAHKFLAKSVADVYYDSPSGSYSFIWDLNVSNDSTSGAFDNNDDYSYNTLTKACTWEYKTNLNFGVLEATFSSMVYVDSTVAANSDCEFRAQWFKNGVMFDSGWGEYNANGNVIISHSAPAVGRRDHAGIEEIFATTVVEPGDIITLKFYLHTFASKLGRSNIKANVLQFQLDYFKVPLGGTIDFQNYTGLKKYKILDLVRGIIDSFNLSTNTDPINKVVLFEPTHSYSLDNDLADLSNQGYFKDDFVDWNSKEDLSKEWRMVNYSDYERELIFKFKDDTNDGILKIIQDRNINKVAAGKYVFPQRFKTGKKEIENRFFSPVMHCEVDDWKSITGVSPQLVCLIPENLSGTSNSEASNTFVPKLCHYKGVVEGVGGWRFDGARNAETGVWESGELTSIPFMFAVNYKDGGQNDPILSYSDEKISNGAGFVIGKGLLKRFFWQRLAIMRNGQWYNTWYKLKNHDVAGQMHREYKKYNGQKWELIEIKDYKPLPNGSTACLLRKWAPIEQVDLTNTYPAEDTVINGTTPTTDSLDIKYAQLKCLATDIPSS